MKPARTAFRNPNATAPRMNIRPAQSLMSKKLNWSMNPGTSALTFTTSTGSMSMKLRAIRMPPPATNGIM